MIFNVVDFEFNQWKGQRADIIELGVAEVDTATGHINAAADIVIKPQRSLHISRYVSAITGLDAASVGRGLSLSAAIRRLTREYRLPRRPWAAFGPSEMRTVLGSHLSFSPLYVDVQLLVMLHKGLADQPSLDSCLAMYGLEPTDGRHCAVIDAIDTARLFCAMSGGPRLDWWPRPRRG